MSITATDPYANLGLSTQRELQSQENDRTKLGQEDFLKLMTSQLQQQDPFKPMENGDFLGQMAQFSTVQGVEDLSGSFNTLSTSLHSSQALQASSMIGRTAFTQDSSLMLGSDGAPAMIELPNSASQVSVSIHDQQGQLLRSEQLGPQSAGLLEYQWDGQTDSGSVAPPGRYHITVNGLIGDRNEALNTLVGTRVESINLDRKTGAVSFNLSGLGSASFDQIAQLR